MALETLKDVKEIDGYEVGVCEDGTNTDSNFIHISHKVNAIAFRIQNGPIKENGVNGCQVDTLIETARIIIDNLNKQFPCRENSLAITKLDESLLWLRERKRQRELRQVEGRNEL